MTRFLATLLLLAVAGTSDAGTMTLVKPSAPHRIANTGSFWRTVYIDPALATQATSDGKTFERCVLDSLGNHGYVCGVRWWRTTDPSAAHVRFYAVPSETIFWYTGHSGYVGAWKGQANVWIGHRLKDAQGGGKPSSVNVTRFAGMGVGVALGWWAYDWNLDANGRYVAASPDAMACGNFSAAIGPPRYGHNALEAWRMRATLGPPWLTK